MLKSSELQIAENTYEQCVKDLFRELANHCNAHKLDGLDPEYFRKFEFLFFFHISFSCLANPEEILERTTDTHHRITRDDEYYSLNLRNLLKTPNRVENDRHVYGVEAYWLR